MQYTIIMTRPDGSHNWGGSYSNLTQCYKHVAGLRAIGWPKGSLQVKMQATR